MIATPERVAALIAADPDFAPLAERYLPLPSRARKPGFAALLAIILEQQVSVAAGRAMWDKLKATTNGRVTPRTFLKLDEATLKACGFSRMKMAYGRGLAEAVLAKSIDLDGLATADDETAMAELTRLKGVGTWTAEVYLMFCLGRTDVMPAKDLALQVGAQWLKGLPARPSHDELYALAEPWRPYRSVAAMFLWKHYRTILEAGRAERKTAKAT